MRIRQLAAFTATAAAAALVLSGCAGGEEPGGQPTAAVDSPTDLTIGNFLDVTSWDPALADIGFDGPYLSAVYDSLVVLDADGNPQPSLATDWTVSEDGTTITLDLRTDAVFSDGEPVDADAVVASLEHLKAGARSGEVYATVSGFSAVDDDTVEISLTERDDTLLYFMGLGRSYVMSPAAIEADSLVEAPVGSGPYTLDASTSVPGSEYHFTKVEDHWEADAFPFATVVVYPIMDATARHNAMLSGQINVNYGDRTNQAQAEEQGWNIAARVSGWVGIQFTDHTGQKLEALGSTEVRQALNYAIDAAGVLSAVGAGAGVVTNQVFPDGGPVNDPALNEMYAHNIDKAKELLASAGYADGFEVSMPMSPVFQVWQPSVEQAFGELGIAVAWDDMQQPDYQLNAPSYPMFLAFLALDGNPLATVKRQVTNPQWFNPNPDYTEFPEVAEIVDTIETTTGDEQLEAISELNATLTELAWWSVWYQAENTYFSVPGITVQPIVGQMFPQLRFIQQG